MSEEATTVKRLVVLFGFLGVSLALLLSSGGGEWHVLPNTDRIINEDEPGWDCRNMGNHVCGDTIYFDMGGELHGYELSAPDRPGCFVEPSRVSAGYEVIFYPALSMRADELGFEVPCPR